MGLVIRGYTLASFFKVVLPALLTPSDSRFHLSLSVFRVCRCGTRVEIAGPISKGLDLWLVRKGVEVGMLDTDKGLWEGFYISGRRRSS